MGSFNYIGSKGNKHWDGFYCLSGMSQSTMTLLVRFGENKASSPYLTMQSFLFFVPPPLPVRTEKTGFVGGTGLCYCQWFAHIWKQGWNRGSAPTAGTATDVLQTALPHEDVVQQQVVLQKQKIKKSDFACMSTGSPGPAAWVTLSRGRQLGPLWRDHCVPCHHSLFSQRTDTSSRNNQAPSTETREGWVQNPLTISAV